MTVSKRNMVPPSADGIGQTDLARLDAHVIQASEYDEIPKITDTMMARAVPGSGHDIARRGRGRPKSEAPKRQVTLRLDGDVIAAMRASGQGWQARANAVLRERFKA
ncbi:BrnA antitoxin family protein [Methylobacterium sp. WL120]|nr:BrnA antitoxin family protein [Methylobacterium sp. WL120]